MLLCFIPEFLIVIRSASAAILYFVLQVVKMNHFMQHSRSDFFNRPLQRPCRDVKFTLVLVFNAPCLANGHMTVCRGRVLNRNNRFFQFPVEAVRVQGPENLFQISCRSARSDCLFHCTHSLYHNKKSGLPESRGRFRLPAVRTGHFRLSS